MSLTLTARQSVVKELSKKYRRVTKKEKSKIIDNLISLTNYNRCYARYVLRNYQYVRCRSKSKRQNKKKYDEKFLKDLKKIWYIYDNICGKRLAPFMPEAVDALERHGEIEIHDGNKHKLLSVSAATIDRLLKAERKKYLLGRKGHTKPGTLLKSQIPIRTFADWNENKAGFTEMDLVGHSGGNSSGQFNYTLDLTDIKTCWTELRAVLNKARVWTFEAIEDIRYSVPFEIKGLDSDNGGEFINEHLYQYCLKEKITFTRARSSRKNDNCYVEQKNWSVVRRAVGYKRFDTESSCKTLNELYTYLNLYVNHFQPVMKLKEKIRCGNKVKKIYDTARTPYRRVLEEKSINQKEKDNMIDIHEQLNPVELKRNITRLQKKLMKIKVITPLKIAIKKKC